MVTLKIPKDVVDTVIKLAKKEVQTKNIIATVRKQNGYMLKEGSVRYIKRYYIRGHRVRNPFTNTQKDNEYMNKIKQEYDG